MYELLFHYNDTISHVFTSVIHILKKHKNMLFGMETDAKKYIYV